MPAKVPYSHALRATVPAQLTIATNEHEAYAAGHESSMRSLPTQLLPREALGSSRRFRSLNMASSHIARSLALFAVVLSVTGCGVAETGASAAASAAAKAEEARQGLQTEQRVREQLDAAAQHAAEQRKAAEDGT